MYSVCKIVFFGLCIPALFFSQELSAQVPKKFSLPLSHDDTSYFFRHQRAKNKKLSLTDLTKDQSPFYFRVDLDGQLVNIRQDSSKKAYGQVINYTYAYSKKQIPSERRKVYAKCETIEPAKVLKAQALIKKIRDIPTDDSVKGWAHGFDGITYTLESSTPSVYTFKKYWTPRAQDDTLQAAKHIQSFVDSLDIVLELTKSKRQFVRSLKPGSYTTDDFSILIKGTKRQARRWNRDEPCRAYMDSIREFLNEYLTDTLVAVLKKEGVSFSSCNSYALKFSKKNKLSKIKILGQSYFTGLAEVHEYYREKRIIRKAFRSISADFVHSKVNYWKSLQVSKESIFIY